MQDILQGQQKDFFLMPVEFQFFLYQAKYLSKKTAAGSVDAVKTLDDVFTQLAVRIFFVFKDTVESLNFVGAIFVNGLNFTNSQ